MEFTEFEKSWIKVLIEFEMEKDNLPEVDIEAFKSILKKIKCE